EFASGIADEGGIFGGGEDIASGEFSGVRAGAVDDVVGEDPVLKLAVENAGGVVGGGGIGGRATAVDDDGGRGGIACAGVLDGNAFEKALGGVDESSRGGWGGCAATHEGDGGGGGVTGAQIRERDAVGEGVECRDIAAGGAEEAILSE